MNSIPYEDAWLREVLRGVRTIAVVGASDKWERASYHMVAFLLGRGYRVFPVNPILAGREILGQPVVASLADIGEPVDLVDVFRNSEDALQATRDAIAARARTVWMQFDVINEQAAAEAQAAGLRVVMDRCLEREIPRLGA